MFRSFSFRTGVVFFILITCILVSLRLFSYHQLLATTEDDIRSIIQAHAEEIEHGVERDGIRYATYLAEALGEQSDNPHLIVALRSATGLHGNVRQWPKDIEGQDGWFQTRIFLNQKEVPVEALVFVEPLKVKQDLLVGYDLSRIARIKQSLVASLIQNVWVSILVSLLLTPLLIYLINRHLERMNDAYKQVMSGNIAYRVQDDPSQDAFSRLGRNFNEMMDWVGSLISTLKDSTNSLAHDLRTPLARIRLRLQQMGQGMPAGDARRERLDECIEDIDELTALFNSILSIAKAEDLSRAQRFEPLDVKAMLQDLAEYYEAYLEDEQQTIRLDLPAPALMALGERQLLSQALMNLIGNASKFAPAQSEITLSAQKSAQHKGMVEIVVADKGEGIPEEFREKVKERFFRLDESRHTPGTGLGLNLVDTVIRLHRGKLILEDNQPGLRAVVLLPEAAA